MLKNTLSVFKIFQIEEQLNHANMFLLKEK